MSRNFQVEQAKANLANDILQEFTSCMQTAGELNDRMDTLMEELKPVVESYADLPRENIEIFSQFMSSLTAFILEQKTNNNLLYKNYNSLLNRTSQLIEEYKRAAGV